MKTETLTKKRTEIFLDQRDLLNLPALQGVLKSISGVRGIEITYRVPGGGDWSGMDAPVDGKHPIKVVIESQEEEQRTDLRPIPSPEECEVMTVAEFEAAVKANAFTDDDGHGYYVLADDLMTNELALPSDFARGAIKSGFTKVVWFNK